MKKITKTILIISIAVFSGFFLFYQPAQAEEIQLGDKNISVDFDELPFNLSNWAPGDNAQKTIIIENNENFDIDVYFKASSTSTDKSLANVLTITANNQSKLLSDLFNNNMVLASVSSGESQDYNITISFDSSAENKYQNKTINFDFIIIAERIGEKGNGEISSVTIPGGGYILPTPEAVTTINSGFPAVTSDSATINGATDISSFCRVIYDNTSHPSLGEPPNYGYEWSTEPTDTKTTSHDMTLTDLESGIIYYYRFICWASPEKISGEHSFTTLAAAEGEKEGEMSPEQETEENIISGEEEEKEEEGTISSEEAEGGKKESGEEKEETKENPKNEEEAPKTQPEVKGVTKPAPPKEPAPQKLSNETPENKTGLMANLAMASGKITQSPFLTFVVILCLVSLVAVGVRKWWLFQKKRKK